MTAFTAWKFETPEGAAHAESLLQRAEEDKLVVIVDHAVISWPSDDEEPTLRHGHEDTWRGAGWGAMWGLLMGAMVAVPVVGHAAGAGLGALRKATEKMGISEDQLRTIGQEITPGTSALFLVTQEGNLDRLGERMRGVDMKLLSTNLIGAEQAMLNETLGK